MTIHFLFVAAIQLLWPQDRMPDAQPHQVAVPSQAIVKGFDADAHRVPYLEWCPPPAKPNGGCVVIFPGGGYIATCDGPKFKPIEEKLLANGFVCVYLWYRTPRPKGLRIYQTAWEDAQRGIRLVRKAAKERGFAPEDIGVVGCSAGSHLALLVALSSQTAAYSPVDADDALPCHVNWATLYCPAFVLTDGLKTPNRKGGSGSIDPVFRFDAKTCPAIFFHGLADEYSANASRRLHARLKEMGIPTEIHLDPGRGHGLYEAGERFEKALAFHRKLKQKGKQ